MRDRNQVDFTDIFGILVLGITLVSLIILAAMGFTAFTMPGPEVHATETETETETIPEAEPVISSQTRELLAKIVYLEAGGCGEDCQHAVISVILNRVSAGYWGDSIESVIYYPNAFESVNYLDRATVIPETVYDSVDYILQSGTTVPAKVMYFRDSYDFSWEGYANYCVYDNMYFGYFTNGDH